MLRVRGSEPPACRKKTQIIAPACAGVGVVGKCGIIIASVLRVRGFQVGTGSVCLSPVRGEHSGSSRKLCVICPPRARA